MISEDMAKAAMPPAGFVHDYMRYGYAVVDAPLVYHMGVAHALLGAVMPPSVSIRYGGPIYGTQWVLLIGASGDSRKTVCIGLGKRIMRQVNANVLMKEPESEAGLLETLAEDPTRLLIYGEFGNFLAGTKNGSYKESLRTRFMSLWDCEPASRKTLKREVVVEQPRLNLLAGCAPSFLETQTTTEDWTAGFLNRWLILAAARERTLEPPPAGGWPEMEDHLVRYLAFLSTRNLGPCVDWHPEAVHWWKEWVARLDVEYADQLSLGDKLSGFSARAKVVALKAALTYSLDFGEGAHANGAPWRLGLDVLQPACALAELHLTSTIHAVSSFALSRHAREQRVVLEAVGDRVRTLGGILRRCQPRMDKRDVVRVLDTLVEASFLYSHKEASVDGRQFWSQTPFDYGTELGNVVPFSAG